LPQPGLGMAPSPYRVQGLGTDQLVNNTSGYLTTTVNAWNQATLTISRATIRLYLPWVANSP
jgi:hypothetical protein